MSTFSPNPQIANTPTQLADQLFQVPQSPTPAQPIQQQWAPQVTLSGGVVPAGQIPAQPVSAPAGFQYPPVAPPIQYPPVQPVQQIPVAPVQPVQAPPQAPAPNRSVLNNLVAQNQLTAQEAAQYDSDETLFIDLLNELNTRQTPPTPQAPVVQTQTPQAPSVQQQGPSVDELNRQVLALQQSGALVYENGRYAAKYPDFQGVAERANQERMKAEQNLQELADPRAWIRKNGDEIFAERVKPLQEQIERLQQQLVASLPKPHEGWVEQHRTKLYLADPTTGAPTQNLSPAGAVYHQTYTAAKARGVQDPRVLHEVAATAAENMFQYIQATPAPPQAPQPQQTFWQAAGSSPQPINPGFNLPGTQLSQHQPNRIAVPVTNQGHVDFLGIRDGILNGNIPR